MPLNKSKPNWQTMVHHFCRHLCPTRARVYIEKNRSARVLHSGLHRLRVWTGMQNLNGFGNRNTNVIKGLEAGRPNLTGFWEPEYRTLKGLETGIQNQKGFGKRNTEP